MELGKTLATLRWIRGWTQEELADRCGLSVRTIRNVELGWVENPRPSSVNLLLRALDADGVDGWQLDDRGPGGRWQGMPAPNLPIVGRRGELDQVARAVLAGRLTTLLGFGGVGKSRVALGVAGMIWSSFRHGVVLVELGDVPAEVAGSPPPTATVLSRVRRFIGDGPADGESEASWHDRRAETHQLIILDNTEHLPCAVTSAAKELLSIYPRIHLLITTRRPLTERLGVSREIGPLSLEPLRDGDSSRAPAVELVLRGVAGGSSVAAKLPCDLPAVVELCRRLGGVPRAMEFAAERLRTIPIHALLASGPALSVLRTSDHSLLPHQRSLASSIRWSIDLLSDDHRRLLRRIAKLPAAGFVVEQVVDVAGPRRGEVDNDLGLFSDLVDNALVTTSGGRLYEYRLMPYVREVVCADPVPQHARPR